MTYDALILAGGRGSRMAGRDKGWIMWEGHPLIEHVMQRLDQQSTPPARILISANRNIDAYQQTGHLVVTDERADFIGPLAGVEAGLMRCKKNNLLVVPCDTPLLPLDLFERLQQEMDQHSEAMAAYAVSTDGSHPLCCLLQPSINGSLSQFLDKGHGPVLSWLEKASAVAVHFDDTDGFRNFNTLEIFQSKRNSP
jgi:molybdopterin-guanine dinucleotide biosynthesis protein A